VNHITSSLPNPIRFLVAAVLLFGLSGCGSDGDDGAPGAQGPAGPPGGSAVPIDALNITIQGVSMQSPPVVTLTVTDQDGTPLTDLSASNLRYTIAKLIPPGATASQWQNYVLSGAIPKATDPGTGPGGTPALLNGAVQGSRRNCATLTLINASIGQYTCTFDIRDDIVANNGASCPNNLVTSGAGCKDAAGNNLDLSYVPNLTHRVGLEARNLPATNKTYDFIPNTGAPPADPNDPDFNRDIVKTANCNNCHGKLAVHGGGRVDTKYCITCHNPGSTDPNSGRTVDFKEMIHKIHYGAELPSVNLGPDQTANNGDEIPYVIWGYRNTPHDFSDVHFPADVRSAAKSTVVASCAKCHDPEDNETPQANDFQTPTQAACGSCHDNISFVVPPDPDPNRMVPHSGGPRSDAECLTCHDAGSGPGLPGAVDKTHIIPERAEAAKFEFNIVDVTGGATPVIQISVTDPTNSDAPYDIVANDPFTGGGTRLAVIIGWGPNTVSPLDPNIVLADFNNTEGATNTGFPNFQTTAALPLSINPIDACDGTPIADWTCTVASGVYTLTKQTPLPASAAGTGRVGFEGHVAADFDGDTSFDDEVPVKSVVKDWLISGTSLVARRDVVDIAKCQNCHDLLSLHGGNRNDEPRLCVMCHNPNATDIGRRPAGGVGTADGKAEEAIDFKRLIHGVHAASVENFDGTIAHGFRNQGLVVWGFPGSPCDWFNPVAPPNDCEHDFSHVRFPGVLAECESCHLSGTYKLEGTWELPTQNGILASTVTTNASTGAATDPNDDENITPTAAVCSSCHDSEVAQSHMELNGAFFTATQNALNSVVESCAVCHGPGKIASVELVHEDGFGEEIP